jgi:hypothetical protein
VIGALAALAALGASVSELPGGIAARIELARDAVAFGDAARLRVHVRNAGTRAVALVRPPLAISALSGSAFWRAEVVAPGAAQGSAAPRIDPLRDPVEVSERDVVWLEPDDSVGWSVELRLGLTAGGPGAYRVRLRYEPQRGFARRPQSEEQGEDDGAAAEETTMVDRARDATAPGFGPIEVEIRVSPPPPETVRRMALARTLRIGQSFAEVMQAFGGGGVIDPLRGVPELVDLALDESPLPAEAMAVTRTPAGTKTHLILTFDRPSRRLIGLSLFPPELSVSGGSR